MTEEECRRGSDAVRPNATMTGRLSAALLLKGLTNLYIDGKEKDDEANGRRIMAAS
jgi:hypothetical protein